MTLPPFAKVGMPIRFVLLLLAFLVGSGAAAGASTYAEAGRLLDGEWRSEGVVLRVDAERAQATITPARPFEWKRFVIKSVSGNEVIFAIGAELYEATVDGSSLRLTGTTFRGELVFLREPELRGSAD